VSLPFTVTGSVHGLYPGASLHLHLTVHNDEPFAIVVRSISTTVHDASARCRASNLVVQGFTGTLRVPRHGRASVTVPVRLGHTAPNACQGATFRLTYTGRAGKA
jgi:hypothetical protein